MSRNSESPATPTGTNARRVEQLRNRKGWNAAQLGEALAEHGVPWDRFTVRALENGKRQNVTVTEALALALVLDVAPVYLMVPLDDDVPFQVAPERLEPSGQVREWLRGHAVMPGQDARTYRSEVAVGELPGAYRAGERSKEQLAHQRRVHERLAAAGPEGTSETALEDMKRLDSEPWEDDDAGR